jgi:uncharacterized protein YjbI with pentapeptide repeats
MNEYRSIAGRAACGVPRRETGRMAKRFWAVPLGWCASGAALALLGAGALSLRLQPSSGGLASPMSAGGVGPNLRGAMLQDADFRGARLKGAKLGDASLSGADLSAADLRGANLQQAILDGATLEGADARGAVLRSVSARGAHLAHAELGSARASCAVFYDVDLTGADLSHATLCAAFLQKARLVDADMSGADLRAADLSGADLTGADLRGARLDGAAYTRTTRWPAGFRPRGACGGDGACRAVNTRRMAGPQSTRVDERKLGWDRARSLRDCVRTPSGLHAQRAPAASGGAVVAAERRYGVDIGAPPLLGRPPALRAGTRSRSVSGLRASSHTVSEQVGGASP